MGLILFDNNWENLKPLTLTRPVAELRIGILTIREKWERMLNMEASYYTAPYLSAKYPTNFEPFNILVNGSILPTQELCDYILQTLPANTLLVKGDTPIVLKTTQSTAEAFLTGEKKVAAVLEFESDCVEIEYSWDLFMKNGAALKADYALLTEGRTSQALSATNNLIGAADQVFLEEGAWVECATLNTENGPIYIGKNATVMEGSMIRGGFALCASSSTKMGTKVYGPTTIGPHSKIGGEVNNSIILGYTNKGHDGFLGNSVLGEWCNLGADTNNSNLKNNYGEVRVWNYSCNSFFDTGLQFCGLIMGDHSKTGINTMLNTGTVVGVSSNLFGGDFPRKYVPSFSWGSNKGFETYQFDKAMETAARVMERRNKPLDAIEQAILEQVFEETKENRKY
ncbi:MAG: Glucose-1-phosphate thymidylyltransferase (EC [uncultured Aureispira sp.]|uniref:Glucose-1-phosphate thymidylyltransferase (EC) n=1 Tax=uncultured Aureispira sp. TaxID=1331704 RepID=A0A6S6UKB5_9BACT|nr:MAG: Glucose-1-phosphate thymidylyltransferase (EC [uncultured Aureispira sp.]